MQPNPIIPLEDVRIAKPCRADWQNMTGDERARFCGSCHKNVYDISQMTRAQAQQLIAEKEGDVCVRLYRRPDGTVITSDCPVGKREVMKPMWWTLAGFVALMASGAAVRSQPVAAPKCPAPTNTVSLRDKARALPLIGAVVNKISPQMQVTMGDVAVAPPTVAPIGKPPIFQADPPPMLGRIQMPPRPAATAKPKPQTTPEPEMGEPTMGAPMAPHAPSQKGA